MISSTFSGLTVLVFELHGLFYVHCVVQGRQPFELVGHIQSKQGSCELAPFQQTKKERSWPEIQTFFSD